MSSDATAESLDLEAVERELCRIPDIQAARIVVDDAGAPVEVHVVALPGKHPKQLARDIQSVAMASFHLDLDRRLISIVQLDSSSTGWSGAAGSDAAEPDPELASSENDDRRIVLAGVAVEPVGHRSAARVVLRRDDETAVGTAEGSSAPTMSLRLVADAALDALRQLDPSALRADVEAVGVVPVGSRMVALVAVVIVTPPYEEIVSGSAVVRAIGPNDAVVRAVLNATNRRLPRIP